MRPYFLLFPVLLLLSVQAADIRVDDPVGNLTGDAKRGYLDITGIIVRQETDSLIVRIEVGQPFPEPSTLLGTGMQFVFRFLGEDEEAPPGFACDLELGDRGWSIHHSGKDNEPLPIDFSVNPTTVNLEFPLSLLGDASRLEIVADTANHPKWKPPTANPAIMVDLPPPPISPETAIQ